MTSTDRDTTTALEIESLRFRYPPSRDAIAPDADDPAWLIDVPALALAPGEQVLLTGGSGRGKSTLLQLIAGLLDPSEGAVRIQGEPIHARRGPARDRFRGQRIGMIFQTFNLLQGFSAIENVMLALTFSDVPAREHKPRAAALLDELGIERHGAPPERLSIGQQQRVAVARALACDPPLVLADEPTASLDSANAGAAMDRIQQACSRHNAALLCVSHDPALPERFTRRASLDELASPDAAPAKEGAHAG